MLALRDAGEASRDGSNEENDRRGQSDPNSGRVVSLVDRSLHDGEDGEINSHCGPTQTVSVSQSKVWKRKGDVQRDEEGDRCNERGEEVTKSIGEEGDHEGEESGEKGVRGDFQK